MCLDSGHFSAPSVTEWKLSLFWNLFVHRRTVLELMCLFAGIPLLIKIFMAFCNTHSLFLGFSQMGQMRRDICVPLHVGMTS